MRAVCHFEFKAFEGIIMQKTIALFAVILIGATASFSFAAQTKTPASKTSQAQSASKPAKAMPHDMSGMSHDMSGMKH